MMIIIEAINIFFYVLLTKLNSIWNAVHFIKFNSRPNLFVEAGKWVDAKT